MKKKSEKWTSKAEKNIAIKEIYNNPAKMLSPSVDEWLKMSKKRRSTISAMHNVAKIKVKL